MLAGAKGFRKLDNYMRKVRDDAEVRRRPGITREDLEILDFEREQVREQAAAKKMVERIVASREAEEGGEEYLVKCKNAFRYLISMNVVLTGLISLLKGNCVITNSAHGRRKS